MLIIVFSFFFLVCRRQKTMQVDATVFTCISMLSRAMGPSIQPDIKELLEPMLAVGLRWVHQAARTDSFS